ncbi:hypothetical protein [Amycolatopsis pigmentata]|uniref:Uncharacterized protein n=1 Tax=Amycolatopsis pigmentata TaxID=450801 RepID=A0ABW5G7V6_9PSEU
MRTLDEDDHYGFEFVSVDSAPKEPNDAVWKTEIRVVATGESVHTWVENSMETTSFTHRPAVGRPRVVDDLLALPGKHLLGTPVFTGVQPIKGNEVGRHVPKVFRVFDRPDVTIASSEVVRLKEEWSERLELEYAERNQVEQDFARTLDYADRLQHQVDRLQAKLDWLQRKMSEQGQAELFWSAPEGSMGSNLASEDVNCVSDAVIVAQENLGDYLSVPESAPQELDGIDAAAKAFAWGNTTWRGLRALAEYAKARRSGFNGNFWTWCENGGALVWSPSTKKLAMTESEPVLNNGKLRKRREFAVSTEVDPSGVILMTAHLKISEGGGDLAPRVYFHDDTGGKTGRVHVGFVGPHYLVPNTKS